MTLLHGEIHQSYDVTRYCANCNCWFQKDDPSGCLCKRFGKTLTRYEADRVPVAVLIPDKELADAHLLYEDIWKGVQ